jgi:hypothetical protein
VQHDVVEVRRPKEDVIVLQIWTEMTGIIKEGWEKKKKRKKNAAP